MNKFIEYLFKPFERQYESYGSTQVYNRMWYILAIICNPLTVGISGAIIIKNNINSIVYLIIVVGIFSFNLIQLCIVEKVYENHCESLEP